MSNPLSRSSLVGLCAAIALSSVVAPIGAPSVANAQRALPADVVRRISSALKKEQCLDSAQLATKEWSRILDLYVVGPTAKTNVGLAFKGLRVLHEEDLSRLEAFAKVPVLSSASPAELSKALEELQGSRTDLQKKRDAVRQADVDFLRFVSDAEQALVDTEGILSRPPAGCEPNVTTRIASMRTDARKHREDVTLARKDTSQSTTRRESMFALTYEARKTALLAANASATGQALDVIAAQLRGTIALADMLPDFERWSFQKVAKGHGDGEITFYQQYEQGLANVEREIAETYAWRKRFEDVEGAPALAKDIALASVDSFISNLTSMRAKYEGMGWQGFLSQQRITMQGMQKIRDKYPPACGPLLDAFELASRDVPSIVEYRGHERVFKSTMKVCRSGNRGVRP